MAGFRFNGCGAKDYFSKVKFLGEHLCPNCRKIAPFYLEKGKFKISVFWIPTITLKERYAIMCKKCSEGKWIEDAEAYSLLNGKEYSPDQSDSAAAETAYVKCPQCGTESNGTFCEICGTKLVKAETENGTAPAENNVSESLKPRICSKCGSEVTGVFCSMCGTKYQESAEEKNEAAKTCSHCGAEVDGAFCSICGTKYDMKEDTAVSDDSNDSGETDTQSKEEVVSQEWECSLCGTKNPKDVCKCSLCGCEK